MSISIDECVARFQNAEQTKNGYSVKCPAHEDHRNSAHISQGRDGRILIHCYAGCSIEKIVAAVGLTVAQLMPARGRELPSNGSSFGSKPRIVAEYDYCDESGQLLYQVLRYDPKNFKQRRPDENSGWDWSVKGVRRVPYNLPEILRRPGERIVCVEGERDADNLMNLGLLATCNSGGAGKWPFDPEYNACFRGRHVVIVPDQDAPGRAHAAAVASILKGVAKNVKVVNHLAL